MKGEAEAFAVEAKGRAEAEQMTKKAEAFQQYKDGAMVDMLLEKLPLVSLSALIRMELWERIRKPLFTWLQQKRAKDILMLPKACIQKVLQIKINTL